MKLISYRYVREWLKAMVVERYVDYQVVDDGDNLYIFPKSRLEVVEKAGPLIYLLLEHHRHPHYIEAMKKDGPQGK